MKTYYKLQFTSAGGWTEQKEHLDLDYDILFYTLHEALVEQKAYPYDTTRIVKVTEEVVENYE